MKKDNKPENIGFAPNSSPSGAESMSQLVHIPESDGLEKIDWQKVGNEIPVLPLRNNVLFPHVVMPVASARPTSMEIIKNAYNQGSFLICVTQKDPQNTTPGIEDLYPVGTIARIIKFFIMPDGSASAVMHGVMRVKITGQGANSDPKNGILTATYKAVRDFYPEKTDGEFDALISSIRQTAMEIAMRSGNAPEYNFAMRNIHTPGFLISFIVTNIEIDIKDKNAILAINSIKKRAMELLGLLTTEQEKVKLRDDIQDKVKRQMDKKQREYFLNQQIKTLQDELGGDPTKEQLDELEQQAQQKDWPEYVKKAFEKQFARLKTIHPQSPDFATELTYSQTLLELPWNFCTQDDFTIEGAKKVLDDHHYGLEKVKERILEYLAVLKLKKNLKSPILCLYGPPGVGKTSLGKSIAEALNRKYVRVSLGGLYDEAEIRGHRRTYIGAMPGRIIKNIKKAGSSNPVFVLDEIDKIDSSNVHGDPASALLEVLDPEQNSEFHDNYLDLDYDLSNVLFIATANQINRISDALLDRMELIEVSGYVTEEKIEISKRHLLPKILENHGLKPENFSINDDVLRNVINNYTRESGVRELSNTLATLARKTAVKVASQESYSEEITQEKLSEELGKPKYLHDEYFSTRQPGVIPGLAWTSAGGELLYIESLLSNGNGTLNITGNVGKVMKESAEIAINYLCANEDVLGIDHRMFKEFDLSLHFPEGAVPKDGPSAGITIFTSLASVYTQRLVKPRIAMTGELTLSGRVLPVGGIKEKILGAKRAGIQKIFMSEENKRDIEEINPLYIDGLEFVYVKTAMELIPLVLEDEKVKNAIKLKDKKLKNNN